jgi:hypothetical protein
MFLLGYGVAPLTLFVDPILEVGSRYPPLSTEFYCGQSAAAQLAGDHKRRDTHVLADVGNSEPLLGKINNDALHACVLPDTDAVVKGNK